jgi:hypothetical protein
MPIIFKCGSLKLLEPSGPVKACNGIAFTVRVQRVIITVTKRASTEYFYRLDLEVVSYSIAYVIRS